VSPLAPCSPGFVLGGLRVGGGSALSLYVGIPIINRLPHTYVNVPALKRRRVSPIPYESCQNGATIMVMVMYTSHPVFTLPLSTGWFCFLLFVLLRAKTARDGALRRLRGSRRRGTRTSRAVMPKRRRDDAPAAAAPAGCARQLASGALEAKIRELVLRRGANKTC
jgi:hypothetical protein